MDNLTKLLSKLTINNNTHEEDIQMLTSMFNKMSLTSDDSTMSDLIDKMQILTINNDNVEITMKDATKIKIFFSCTIQSNTQMESIQMVNCFKLLHILSLNR